MRTILFLSILFGCSYSQVRAQGPNYIAHSLAICEQGTVKSFGLNLSCQLGIGSTSPTNHNTPVTVDSISDAVAVAVGASHSLVLLSTGKVFGWGYNVGGQTGQPPSSMVCTPTEVPGLCCCVVAIAAGEQFSVALMADSTVVTWGSNQYGQLGDGNAPTGGNLPRQVTGISNAIAISAGGQFAMALLADSTIVAWGMGGSGQLGNGTSNSDVPLQVSGLQDVVMMDAGGSHAIAKTASGTIYTWGDNFAGQLGVGSTPTSSSTPLTPSSVSGSGIIDVAAGLGHTMVLKSNGTTKVFGQNNYGQFGIASPSSSNTPISGPTISGAVDIVAPPTYMHSWAVTSSEDLYTWGRNAPQTGALGIGSTDNYVATPSLVSPGCDIVPNDYYNEQPCCVHIADSAYTILCDTTLATTQTFNGTDIIIFGTLNILNGATVTMNDCDVMLATEAKVNVTDGATLDIVNGSHLYGCDELWRDIFIENGSNVEVSGNSIIEDAHNALNIEDGAAYMIDGAIFNRNFWHVQISEPDASPVHAVGTITDSHFLCQTTTSIGGSPVHELLLPPRDNDTTDLGVWAWVTRGLKVSDNNEFNNCGYGVSAWLVGEVEVRGNNFTDIHHEGISITESGASGADIDIVGNTLTRMPYGIYCVDNPGSEMRIDSNTVTFAGMASPPQQMTGILVYEITPGNSSSPNLLRIMDNEVLHAPCGIHIANLFGMTLSSTVYVGENTITHTKIPNDTQAGILMQNVSGAVIKGNDISNPSSTVNWWETGTRCDGTTNMFFCDTLHHIGNALFFDNDNRPTTLLVQNVMDTNHRGILLNNAIIGAQGGTEPNDNKWLGSYWSSSNPHIQSMGLGALGNLSPFHVHGSNPPYYPLHRTAIFSGTPVPPPTTTKKNWTLGCLFSPPSYKTDEENPALAEALSMVDETQSLQAETDRERSMLWNGQFGLYRKLLAEEELRYSDDGLNSYFAEKDAGNMGQLYRAMADFNAMRTGNVGTEAAEQSAFLQSISSDLLPEQRLSEVLQILYPHGHDLWAISPDGRQRLREIAQMCPIDEGFGVYIARSTLLKIDTTRWHYVNDCELVPAPAEQKSEGVEAIISQIRTYPNPSHGKINVEYSLKHGEFGALQVFSVQGGLQYTQQLISSANVTTVDLEGLSSGLYLMVVTVNGERRYSERISLLKE